MKHVIAIIICLLIPFILVSQDLTKYYDYVNQDKADLVKLAIPQLIGNYPNNPDVLYLSALVEPEGDKALLIYKDVLSQYPNSNKADNALTKIIEYLYAKGLYKKTITYSKQLIAKYPDSENVGNCVYMLLCSFNVMNKKDSVDYYYAHYLEKYSDLDLQFYDYQSVPLYVTGDQFATKVKQVERVKLPEQQVSKPKYALQVGAFGNPQNALILKNRLKSYGYDPYVQKIKGSRQDLLSVRVGRYDSRADAAEAGNRLKALHNIDYIVIQRDQWE
ncbi:SPOR domain-containing protein [bacterium]|nr:SPOR domain-containing protein [bacterium]